MVTDQYLQNLVTDQYLRMADQYLKITDLRVTNQNLQKTYIRMIDQ